MCIPWPAHLHSHSSPGVAYVTCRSSQPGQVRWVDSRCAGIWVGNPESLVISGPIGSWCMSAHACDRELMPQVYNPATTHRSRRRHPRLVPPQLRGYEPFHCVCIKPVDSCHISMCSTLGWQCIPCDWVRGSACGSNARAGLERAGSQSPLPESQGRRPTK